MADNQFVPENQLSVNEMYSEKSDLVNQSERSLYSSSNEPQSPVVQLKNTKTALFDVKNKSAIKDFSSENGDLASSTNADLKVPQTGDGISSKNNQHENLIESRCVKPMFKPRLRLDFEESPCHTEHLKQELEEMKVVTNDAELTAEKSSKSEVTATASPTAVISDIELGRRIQKDTPSYIQGPFQLSPFGVKAIESDKGRVDETIDFATLAEWSGVLHQKNQNPMDKTNLDDNETAHQQQPRCILRKEQAETVTKPEMKSVHFGFPVVWTKYFTSDEDNESTTSTELLFSDEEDDEVLEIEDQEVPHNENHDEPCAKKARKDDGSFEVPSFSFPEVISIPNLQMLRFTDEEKDHDMTKETNEPEEEQNFHTTGKNNPKELVESLPTPVTHEYVLDKGTAHQLRQDSDCVSTAEVPCLNELAQANMNRANEPDYEKAAQLPCYDYIHPNDSEYEKSAEVPCHELLLANSDGHPDYTKTAQLQFYDHIQANDYERSAEVPCPELLSANSDGHDPDYTKTAELPCYDHIQANDPEYETSAEVPCHELLSANSDGLDPDYVKSAEIDKFPDVNELCHHVDTEMEEQLQSLKGLVSSSYLKHQRISKVPCSNILPDRCDQNCQHHVTMDRQKYQLREKLVDGQIYDNPEHGKSDILPCHAILHVPATLDQTQQNHLKELVPINLYSSSDDREKFAEGTSEKSFSFSSPSERISQSFVPDSNGLAKMQLVQAEKTLSTNLSRVTTFTVEGAQEVPETVCNTSRSRVHDYLPTGVCSSLLRLGEESLLDEVGSETNTSPSNSEKPWMCKQFLEIEDLSLYENDRGVLHDVSETDEDVTQKLENPSLSPVRKSWTKTSFGEEFDPCDNDHDSCSSQISEIAEEVKNILTMDSSGYEKPQSPDCGTVLTIDENQDYRKLPEPNKYNSQFLEALERDACRLDGPELLEMAMHLVESAIRKSKCPSKRLEHRPGSSAESNKASQTEFKATPAFTWKKFSNESQRAALNLDNQDKNDCDGTNNNSTDYPKLYYNKSCTRPLRVGLSRRNCYHSLHPYAARPRSGNTLGCNHLEASDYKSTK